MFIGIFFAFLVVGAIYLFQYLALSVNLIGSRNYLIQKGQSIGNYKN